MILNESYTLSNGIQIPKLGLGNNRAPRTLENTQSGSLFRGTILLVHADRINAHQQ